MCLYLPFINRWVRTPSGIRMAPKTQCASIAATALARLADAASGDKLPACADPGEPSSA
jgi:hypothetical protein